MSALKNEPVYRAHFFIWFGGAEGKRQALVSVRVVCPRTGESVPFPVVQALGLGRGYVKVVNLSVHSGGVLAVAEYAHDAGLLMLALEILYYLVEHTYDLKIAGILRAQGEARQLQQRLAGGFALRQQAAPLLSKLRGR